MNTKTRATDPPDGYVEIPTHIARLIMSTERRHVSFIHDGWRNDGTGATRAYYTAPWCARLCELYRENTRFPLFAAIELCLDNADMRDSVVAADRLGAALDLINSALVGAADAAERLGADDETIQRALMPHRRS